ncbi:PREDICTED: uncharacterized protein LOC106820293 [Priapulus caudatus]|uniref:Uncharacterized protein LOC106820293 n=1 Tax=Priapulus caudatus TaxID=37621 RepID=A0ABM1F779_PRICU|nr:PREDICTED: uncharacterized protein LOC106820293 [Priapulus caudatus]
MHPAYRITPYMEQLYGSLHSSPMSFRGLSPVERGVPVHPEYLQQMAALSQRYESLSQGLPATPSMDGSSCTERLGPACERAARGRCRARRSPTIPSTSIP